MDKFNETPRDIEQQLERFTDQKVVKKDLEIFKARLEKASETGNFDEDYFDNGTFSAGKWATRDF